MNRVLLRKCTGHSKYPLPTTQEKATYGHHQMVNTEIRLIIFFAAKDGEALYSQQKQDQELTVAQTQFSSVTQSCLTLCDPMNRSMPGLPVHHLLLEFTQTHVHRVGDVIQPSHPLSSPSLPAPNPSQHQGLFQ